MNRQSHFWTRVQSKVDHYLEKIPAFPYCIGRGGNSKNVTYIYMNITQP